MFEGSRNAIVYPVFVHPQLKVPLAISVDRGIDNSEIPRIEEFAERGAKRRADETFEVLVCLQRMTKRCEGILDGRNDALLRIRESTVEVEKYIHAEVGPVWPRRLLGRLCTSPDSVSIVTCAGLP